MDQAAELLSTLGFPIVMAGCMAWYINKQADTHREEMESIRKTVEQNSEILKENTTVIKMIWQQIRGDGEDESLIQTED